MRFFFFFQSRRRHTRLQGDWSSAVCSSDLGFGMPHCLSRAAVAQPEAMGHAESAAALKCLLDHDHKSCRYGFAGSEIGRASCRERVEISVVAVSLKKKKRARAARGVVQHEN